MCELSTRRSWYDLMEKPEWVANTTEWTNEYVTDWICGTSYYDLVIHCGMLYGNCGNADQRIVRVNLVHSELTEFGLSGDGCIASMLLFEDELRDNSPCKLNLHNSVTMRQIGWLMDVIFSNTAGLADNVIIFLAEHRLLYRAAEDSILPGCCFILAKYPFCIDVPVWQIVESGGCVGQAGEGNSF